jgi:hypothetical protein
MTASLASVGNLQPIDDLEDSLIESWREVSRATHRFLLLLREFDLRQGYKAYGNADCAEWLNWKCGIARVTAQEKVRVARALWNLPQVDAAFAKGDLSYSKVRAITRVATGVTEVDLLDYALTVSASQLDRFCSALKHGDPSDSETAARRAREGRSLTRHFREDGTGMIVVELPRAELDLVLQALDQAAALLPDDESRSLFAAGADALVAMARECLVGGREPDLEDETNGPRRSSAGDTHTVLVHVDAAALAGEGGRSDLPLPVVRRLCCDGAAVPIVENGNGDTLSVGRKQRTVPTAIRRALESRDGHCQFPGCSHRRWLDAHHIQHWADGGETSLENLVLLCSYHHTLVHEGGFRLEERGDGVRYFVRPDGRCVESPVGQVREETAGYETGRSSAEDGARRRFVHGREAGEEDSQLWHNRAFLTRPTGRTAATGDENGRYQAPGWLGQVLRRPCDRHRGGRRYLPVAGQGRPGREGGW